MSYSNDFGGMVVEA